MYHVNFSVGYGMSEITVTHFIPEELHNTKPGSCGVVIPGVTSKIVDLETEKICGSNQSGEIYVQGDMVCAAISIVPRPHANI